MTDLANGTWVLVADGEKALFLENVTDGEDPHFKVRRLEEQDNPSDRAQSANRPGRMQEGRPGNQNAGPRSAFDDTDWHKLAKDRFAVDLSDILYRLVHRGEFEHIVLVASPGVLGELRRTLHKEVAARVVGEVPKTLTNHSLDDIEKIVKTEVAAG